MLLYEALSLPSKDDFEQTHQIAEFVAQRLENRRQFEFKIFISYMTLLVLAIYEGHHIEIPKNEIFYGFYVLGLLFVMHFFYLLWTISLSVANRNDSNRRNFYLQKSEFISASLLKKFDYPLCQEMKNEYCWLCPDENEIKKVPSVFGALKHGDQFWINYAVPFQVVLPTIIVSLLVLNVSQELCTGWCRAAVVILIPALPFLVIAISTCYRKKEQNRNERYQTSGH